MTNATTSSPQSLDHIRKRLVKALRHLAREHNIEVLQSMAELYEKWNRENPGSWISDSREARRSLAVAQAVIDRWQPVVESSLEALDQVAPNEWRAACERALSDGTYVVTLSRLAARRDEEVSQGTRGGIAATVCAYRGVIREVAAELVKRVEHVGPERVLEGVPLDNAIQAKTDFERWGAVVKLTEGVHPRSSGRETISERVRNEVWRRDEGKCVDCGSRERLEFDHIVPVSKGGSNTARNIELRCEECNRRKGANI